MYQDHHHVVNIVNFERVDHQRLFVEVAGYDAEIGKEFKGLIKFVDGMPFGDLIHVQRSSLSPGCRSTVRSYLMREYADGQFN